jgi:hypothetical protein
MTWTVGVDQARQYGPALGVDNIRVTQLQHFPMQQAFHLPVVADQDAGEPLELVVRIDLNAIGIGHQRVGERGRGGEERGER